MKKYIFALLAAFSLHALAVDNFNIADNTSATISGGTIDNTVIGGTTPAAGTFNPLKLGTSNDLYLSRTAATTLSIGNTAGATNGDVKAGKYYIGSGAEGIFQQDLVRFRSTGSYQWASGANATAAGDTFLTRYAAKQLMISGDGVGATTNAGWIAGYFGTSGTGALWTSAVTPDVANYAMRSDGGTTIVNASLNGTIGFRIANSPVAYLRQTGSAGEGLSVTAGTATTDVNALNITQTWNDAAVTFTGIKSNVTDTASNSASLLMDLRVGGNSKFTVGKGGAVTIADATDSSSTTTGSLKTAGGLGVAKKAYFGESIRFPGSFGQVTSLAGPLYLDASTGSSLVFRPNNSVERGSVSGTAWTFIGDIVLDKTITAPGTTGAQTINKSTGRVNFAAAATSLVVTNSLATANSICHVTKATNDATMRLGACVAAAGTITIYADVAPAAETAVNFTITN